MSTDPKTRHRWFRFDLVELFLLVALIAGGVGTRMVLWNPNTSNYEFFVGIYVGVFSIATVGAVRWKPVARRPAVVFILFGWTYLFTILQAGGAPRTLADAQYLAGSIRLGLALALLTALAASLVFSRFREQ